jgi:hypothetical protein
MIRHAPICRRESRRNPPEPARITPVPCTAASFESVGADRFLNGECHLFAIALQIYLPAFHLFRTQSLSTTADPQNGQTLHVYCADAGIMMDALGDREELFQPGTAILPTTKEELLTVSHVNATTGHANNRFSQRLDRVEESLALARDFIESRLSSWQEHLHRLQNKLHPEPLADRPPAGAGPN